MEKRHGQMQLHVHIYVIFENVGFTVQIGDDENPPPRHSSTPRGPRHRSSEGKT